MNAKSKAAVSALKLAIDKARCKAIIDELDPDEWEIVALWLQMITDGSLKELQDLRRGGERATRLGEPARTQLARTIIDGARARLDARLQREGSGGRAN